MQKSHPASTAERDDNDSSSKRRRLRSSELFAGTREVVIEHGGDEYRLRLTSQGKLILTK